eukprot:15480265-Heterocapsa_arctica.AAC.1
MSRGLGQRQQEKPQAKSRGIVDHPAETNLIMSDSQERLAGEGPVRGRKLRRCDWNPDLAGGWSEVVHYHSPTF